MAEFSITRSIDISAAPSTCHGLVDDFHAWTTWSPWEDADPDLRRTYTGPDAGVGARYAWSGNRRAGQGSMEIVTSTPERIGIRLEFVKPWRATNPVEFQFDPTATGTRVTWTMTGEHRGLAAAFAKVFNMDKMLGKDFDKGLTRLKAVAEQP